MHKRGVIITIFLNMVAISSMFNDINENKTTHRDNGSFFVKELPKLWREVCLVENHNGLQATALNCTIKSGTTLDIRSLRSILGVLSINLNISIECEADGNLFLPWPAKVPGIESLSVDNCNLLGFNSEYYDENIAKLPDTIRYSKISNSVRIIDDNYLKIMIQSVNSPYTESAECGQVNAEVIVQRNVSQIFENSESLAILFYNNIAKITRSATIIKNICNYKNLKIYENSQNPTVGMNPVGNLLQRSSYPVLHIMNLSRNEMNEIPHQMRKWRLHFPGMNYLDLSYNRISEINNVVDFGREEENNDIGVIDLRHNSIKMLTKGNLESFLLHKFVKIDIRNNPFECDCRMYTVKTFLRTFSYKLPKHYKYLLSLKCFSPTNLKGRAIMELSSEEFECEKSSSKLETKTIIILSTLSGVFIIIVVALIVFRHEIPVLFFTRIYIHITCCSLKVEDDKIYDAFIAFSEENEDWVLQTLMPRLEHPEKPPSFKFCIHQRDFHVGTTIVDNILTCVKKSRYTILIISKAFVRSEWCLMEFRAALQQSLKEKTENLIIVLYEDVSNIEIDEDLRRCLKTVTYVKIEDRLFWDKLVYALSRKQKRSKRQVFHIEEIEMKLQARI